MELEKYSFGVGDRFGCQGKWQLKAIMQAKEAGLDIVPVWNKSHREHKAVGSRPEDVRLEADQSVQALGWQGAYHVDADHINLSNVSEFIGFSDFFTLDIGDYIGTAPAGQDKDKFTAEAFEYAGKLKIPGIEEEYQVSPEQIEIIADKYLFAVREAGKIYRTIEKAKGNGSFITEVSMDETESPQTPAELFFILLMISREGIPAQTIAPKFTGRFKKGVDYVGDPADFEKEFNQDIAVVQFAAEEFKLPRNIKLSVHSGSDKFSIYKPINRALKKFNAGVHVKTAGTTWLEELIGLAEAGGGGLEIAKRIYKESLERFDELTAPYWSVIDISKDRLPSAEEIQVWSSEKFADAIRHEPDSKDFNPDMRQLLHVGYKIAAEMGEEYPQALNKYESSISKNVTNNIYNRHILPLFG
ncbi:hypothetical protein L21SP3_00894 [Sedimentisphaera cyanobacteriorum]|uniref:Tagaturonate/fructuronate epimerase n=1 Tax=Sedimentisphaera cyanobacteriorum TaxID=1940790 RepID=A0A1Q2HPA6_9BACT|nr:tagaturonate epimerase family protein [Sedimentisphaera cyanobacteriorum]AQQ08388.1 hypothetical protein L21SP3_00164 [Sedimentisphaera cyanobacteriorum]AQQ09096.1 hypothetical protein L21SP3_00894 [Sedimentisphaera cyanobacteriorum]